MSAHDVPQNIVYTHPSITALSGYVRASLAGNVADLEDEHAVHVSRMNALLDRYSADFPAPRLLPALLGEDGRTAGEVVLITGTTGVLGSHLLSQLLADRNVERVYALNRASGARKGLRPFGKDRGRVSKHWDWTTECWMGIKPASTPPP